VSPVHSQDGSDPGPTWQPISALGTIASLIDGQLEGGRDQYRSLLEAEVRPYVLDDATVARVQQVYADTAADLWLYDTQLARWADQNLTGAQRREVGRLEGQMVDLHEVVDQVLALAVRLKDHTIETLLAKSDLEVAMEWFLHGRDS
jgi:hypothetical protein